MTERGLSGSAELRQVRSPQWSNNAVAGATALASRSCLVSNTDRRYPGLPPRPPGWIPHPTTAARSWAELFETLQSGFALVDTSWRVAYVSDRFLSPIGTPDDLVGSRLHDLLPLVADGHQSRLKYQLTRGRRVVFEHQLTAPNGERHWYRVMIVPTRRLGADFVAMVFTTDITATSRTLTQLRDATIGLTEIESALHRRLCRDVHDGPIQLLAVLVLRLGLSDAEEAQELQRAASDVAKMLRDVIERYAPDMETSGAALLRQWVEPLLAASGSTVDIDDQRVSESGLLELQAAFVLLTKVLSEAANPPVPRAIHVEISDEHDGERIVLTLQSTRRTPIVGRLAAQLGAIVHHARSVGGTISTWLTDDDVRTFSMWIPKLADAVTSSVEPIERSDARIPSSNDMSALPSLSWQAWEQIANEAPERLWETDGEGRIVFTNPAFCRMIGATSEEMVGMASQRIIELGTIPDGVLDRLDSGEFIETQWRRETDPGDPRLTDLRVSPRLGPGGRWDGFLITGTDRGDVDLLHGIHLTAIAALSAARQQAAEALIQRIEEPLAACSALIAAIQQFEASSDDSLLFQRIRTELTASLERIKTETDVLANPRLTIDDFDVALEESLGSVIDGFQLVVIDESDGSPSPEIADVLFRIAREALLNAVVHGGAHGATIELSNGEGGLHCTIHDDGIGVTPEQLQHRPGHLGTRSMVERANERDGTCRITAHPTIGTLVSVWLPDHTA